MCTNSHSLRSKRFQSCYCAKVRAEAKKNPPPPPSFIFFCACPSFLDEPREETLAMQAIILRGWGGSPLFGLTGYV